MSKALNLGEIYRLPHWIKELKYKARDYASHYGLNIVPKKDLENEVIFEVLDSIQLNKIASKGGFPSRYPHWSFGMEFESLQKPYIYGLQKIYEMVINNIPAYAYLLDTNNPIDQKIVIAHVFGHVDFFRTNAYFAPVEARNMVDEFANHGMRVRRYIEKYGENVVSDWIDICLSIENLIDIHSLGIIRKEKERKQKEEAESPFKLFDDERYKEYMDEFENPPELMEKERQNIKEKKESLRKVEIGRKIPEQPELDVLQFLIDYAPLEEWQRDILSIVREEMYYFSPQGQTKIMNEGWASYWHSKILTGSDKNNEYMKDRALPPLLTDSELIDYADHHSGTLAISPGRLNPYKMGKELFEHIEERWNKGQFGEEWKDCLKNGSYKDQKNFDKKLGLGREKIFEVRKIYNDIGFISEFMDEKFCEKQKMFSYKFNVEKNWYEIASREFLTIRETLLFNLTNLGQPFIYATDGNYNNAGELLLEHGHNGIDLKINYSKEVLARTYKVWQRPVHLKTTVQDKKKLYTFDGKEHKEKSL